MPDKDLLLDWLRHSVNDLISARHLFEDLYPKARQRPMTMLFLPACHLGVKSLCLLFKSDRHQTLYAETTVGDWVPVLPTKAATAYKYTVACQ